MGRSSILGSSLPSSSCGSDVAAGVAKESSREKRSSERISLVPSSSSSKDETTKQLTLDDVNPVGLGGRARQQCDFTTPNAKLTPVVSPSIPQESCGWKKQRTLDYIV